MKKKNLGVIIMDQYNNMNEGHRPHEQQQRYDQRPNAHFRNPNFQSGSRPNGITLKEPYFSQIINKLKTVEGRINSGQFLRMRAGANIKFINGQREVNCKVEGKVSYNSFKEMLEGEGLHKCLPDARDMNEGVRIYNNIPTYSQKAAQFGVVALWGVTN